LSSLIPSIRLQTDKDAGHDDDELDEYREPVLCPYGVDRLKSHPKADVCKESGQFELLTFTFAH